MKMNNVLQDFNLQKQQKKDNNFNINGWEI